MVEELCRQVRDDEDSQQAGNPDAPGMDMDLFDADAHHQTGNGLVYCIHKRERLRLFRLNRLRLYDFLGLLVLFYLDMVEAFTVNTDDGTLRDESIRVDVLDEAEDGVGFPLFGQDEHHLDVQSRVHTDAVDDGYASVHVFIDVVPDFFIMLGDDEELDGLAVAVHNLVEDEAGDEHHHITVNHFFPIVEGKVAGADDDNIAAHDDTSQRNIAIFMYDGRDNICPSRTSIIGEGRADTASAEGCSDDARHERLVRQEMHPLRQFLDDRQEEGQREYRKNSLDTELESQDLQGKNQEDGIDRKVNILYRNTRGKIDDRGDTRNAITRDVVRQEKHGPADCIQKHAYCYHHIVLQFSLKQLAVC